MANKLIKRRYNNLLTARRNYFLPGGSLLGDILNIPGIQGIVGQNPLDSINLKNFGSTQAIHNVADLRNSVGTAYAAPKTPSKVGEFFKNHKDLTTAIGSAVGQVGGGLIGGGLQSGVGNAIQGLSSIAGAIPGPWGAAASAALGVVGGLTNRMFGSKMNTENIAKVEANINELKGFTSDASDFDTLSSNWANAATGMTFDNDFIGKDGWFSHKARDKANSLRDQIETGEAWVQNVLDNNANNISETQMQNLLANYAAFGGNLMTHGADFSTGLTLIGNGGTHEENPLEGVPMGVDQEGTPNLVEEGEVIFNDYVFSKRLKVPKAVRKKYKLRGAKPLSFADAALQMSKEAEERPNDPISMRGMEVLMADLAGAQEELKARNRDNRFANGGRVNKFDGTTTVSNYTRNPNIDRPYTPDAVWIELMGRQLRKRMEALRDMPAGKEKEAAIKAFYEEANKIQDSYYNDIFNSGVEWGGPAIKGAGEAHQKLWNDAGYNNYGEKEYNYWYTPKGTSKDRKDTWVDNIIGDLTYNRHMGDGDMDARAYIELSELAKELGLNYFYNDDKGGLLYFSPIEAAAQRNAEKRMWLTGRKDASGTPLDDLLIPNYDPNTGTYQYVKTKTSSKDNTDYTDIFYKEKPASPESKDDSEDSKEIGEYPNYDNWMRYMPIVGASVGLGTSLFSKPDDSDASAILEASSGKGVYRPVRYKPVGNYLTYRPFDRNYYINKMNAEAGATRRALANTSGGNRATAIAGILSADNNYLNQLGALARQGEEYNLAQMQQREEFNRGTNIQNSEGFLKAAMANQSALAAARDFSLKGAMTAADIRSRARLAREQAISANLSDIFNSLGDIGKEKVDRKWRTWSSKHGVYAPVQSEKANGGKIKRKKRGLTL